MSLCSYVNNTIRSGDVRCVIAMTRKKGAREGGGGNKMGSHDAAGGAAGGGSLDGGSDNDHNAAKGGTAVAATEGLGGGNKGRVGGRKRRLDNDAVGCRRDVPPCADADYDGWAFKDMAVSIAMNVAAGKMSPCSYVNNTIRSGDVRCVLAMTRKRGTREGGSSDKMGSNGMAGGAARGGSLDGGGEEDHDAAEGGTTVATNGLGGGNKGGGCGRKWRLDGDVAGRRHDIPPRANADCDSRAFEDMPASVAMNVAAGKMSPCLYVYDTIRSGDVRCVLEMTRKRKLLRLNDLLIDLAMLPVLDNNSIEGYSSKNRLQKNCIECTCAHRRCLFKSPNDVMCTRCNKFKLCCKFRYSGMLYFFGYDICFPNLMLTSLIKIIFFLSNFRTRSPE
jgi:hypothetical protein